MAEMFDRLPKEASPELVDIEVYKVLLKYGIKINGCN